uniref:Uncharacterized protein n=2 Tax=Caenorhabditis japonica TaxID=281687 RepID=A0A8R1IR81_CAEJA
MTTESPLSKLVEHCNKFGQNGENKMKLEPVAKSESLLLPTEMNAYSPYLSSPNWWVDQASWHHLYPAVTSAAATSIDSYQNYFASTHLTGLLNSSVSAVAAQSAVAQSALSSAMQQQQQQRSLVSSSKVSCTRTDN